MWPEEISTIFVVHKVLLKLLQTTSIIVGGIVIQRTGCKSKQLSAENVAAYDGKKLRADPKNSDGDRTEYWLYSEKNDAFVVCDAGGGTVDLISYEVKATLPQLRLRELVPAGGGMAGSLALNHRFAAVVRRLVGDYQWTALSKQKGWIIAMKWFDRFIKRTYRRNVKEEYDVDFPLANLRDDPGVGLVSDTWHMTGQSLDFVFDPVLLDVGLLIADQVEAVRRKRPDNGVKVRIPSNVTHIRNHCLARECHSAID
ncbi:hypothetical protein AAL_02607 [Moelleriella libera RCEF 2490]|uniref:Uncharacterized protein n=1 Tax=Moelleriella libera RCEF 2490 TaxID=1081109 RepID=A0A168EQT0_9HYPO|nr:hypothetical protein AAL_02607 [Moelleriella libera RCEF 2490]